MSEATTVESVETAETQQVTTEATAVASTSGVQDVAALAAEAQRQAEAAKVAADAAKGTVAKATADLDAATALRAEADALRTLRETIEAERAEANKAKSTAERVAYLRKVGAVPDVSDEDLATLSQGLDPSTEAGRAKIEAWRAARPLLFKAVESPTQIAERQQAEAARWDKLGQANPWMAEAAKRNLEIVRERSA